MWNLMLANSTLLLLFFVSFSNSLGTLITSAKINLLKNCLLSSGIDSSKICLRDSCPKYNIYNYQWSYRQSGPIEAPIYFLPQNSKDVQIAVTCSKELGVSIFPKAGGHSLEKYSYGNSQSLVLDVRNMDDIIVDNGTKTVQIGPGNLNGPLQAKLTELGDIYVPGSVCPTVGITGYSTGGEIEIVVASGEIITANSSQNSDLLYAIKGAGGGSFGIITKFNFNYVKQPKRIMSVYLEYSKKSFSSVFSVWQKYFTESQNQKTLPNYIESELGLNENGKNNVYVFIVDSSESGDRKVLNDFVNEFPKPLSKSKITYSSYIDFIYRTTLDEGGLKKGVLNSASDLKFIKRTDEMIEFRKSRSYYGTKPFSPSELTEIGNFINISPISIQIYFQSWGGKTAEVGIEETSFIHRQKRAYIALIDIILRGDKINSKSLTKMGEKWADDFLKMTKRQLNHTESYQNYPDPATPDILNRFYGSALDKLKQIKRKYDPTNFFNNPESIPLF